MHDLNTRRHSVQSKAHVSDRGFNGQLLLPQKQTTRYGDKSSAKARVAARRGHLLPGLQLRFMSQRHNNAGLKNRPNRAQNRRKKIDEQSGGQLGMFGQ